MIHWPTVFITVAVLGSIAACCFMLWLGLRLARIRDTQEQHEMVHSEHTKVYPPSYGRAVK